MNDFSQWKSHQIRSTIFYVKIFSIIICTSEWIKVIFYIIKTSSILKGKSNEQTFLRFMSIQTITLIILKLLHDCKSVNLWTASTADFQFTKYFTYSTAYCIESKFRKEWMKEIKHINYENGVNCTTTKIHCQFGLLL